MFNFDFINILITYYLILSKHCYPQLRLIPNSNNSNNSSGIDNIVISVWQRGRGGYPDLINNYPDSIK